MNPYCYEIIVNLRMRRMFVLHLRFLSMKMTSLRCHGGLWALMPHGRHASPRLALKMLGTSAKFRPKMTFLTAFARSKAGPILQRNLQGTPTRLASKSPSSWLG
jgi:hypothetical protein